MRRPQLYPLEVEDTHEKLFKIQFEFENFKKYRDFYW